jgi:hypothetical protein
VAHGPVDYAILGFTEIVDPRKAVEIVTLDFNHCLVMLPARFGYQSLPGGRALCSPVEIR